MNILVLHHVEPMWQASMNPGYLETVCKHLDEQSYDQIILTTLEGTTDEFYDEEFWKIAAQTDVVEEWSYAWEDPETERQWYLDSGIDPDTEIIEASGHEFAYVYPWIAKRLKGHNVTLGGGARFECLADFKDTLEHLDIPFTEVDSLVFG